MNLTELFASLVLRSDNTLKTMGEYLQLRGNILSMISFCDNFLPCVVGKTRWKKHIGSRTSQVINDFVSVSDEAFTLLLLENVWDIMHEVSVEEFFVPKKRKRSQQANTNDQEVEDSGQVGKRLLIGRWTKDWRGSKKYGGWAPDGIARYNELVELVTNDRKNDVHFQAQYEIHLKTVRGLQSIPEDLEQPTVKVKAWQDLAALGLAS